jgi:hypothetical protein
MGTEAALLALAGTQVIGAAGDIFAARGRSAYEREILKLNERLTLSAAEDALRRGDIEAAAVRRRGRATIGMQQAALAVSGRDPFTGSSAVLQEETAVLSELDRQAIRVAAWREAYGYRSRAIDFRLQRAMSRIASRQAQAQAVSEAASSIAQTGLAYGARTRQPASTALERSMQDMPEGVDLLLRAVPRY